MSCDPNPWKEALLRSSIRHGHKFYEDDPEKSLEEARVALTEMEIQYRVDQQTDFLEGEIRDLEQENADLKNDRDDMFVEIKNLKETIKSMTEGKTT